MTGLRPLVALLALTLISGCGNGERRNDTDANQAVALEVADRRLHELIDGAAAAIADEGRQIVPYPERATSRSCTDGHGKPNGLESRSYAVLVTSDEASSHNLLEKIQEFWDAAGVSAAIDPDLPGFLHGGDELAQNIAANFAPAFGAIEIKGSTACGR